jgi:hypothetical protein
VRRIAESSIYGEIVQAVPVVIGGLLAVGGGVIAQIATHWLSISRDERNFRRERLEQLVKALFTHQVWLEDKFQAMVFRLEDHNVPDPLNEVRMLQALHFPELSERSFRRWGGTTAAPFLYQDSKNRSNERQSASAVG